MCSLNDKNYSLTLLLLGLLWDYLFFLMHVGLQKQCEILQITFLRPFFKVFE